MTEEEMKAQEAAAAAEAQKAAEDAAKAGDEEKKPAEERKPREIFYERIRTNRPESKYDEDEEEYFRNAGSIMDELEGKAKSYDDMTAKIMGRFKDDPESAATFLDYIDGMSLPAAIRKNMGDEALSMKEGDEGWDEYVEAGKERKKRMDDAMAFAEELKANGEQSDATIAEFAKENNMTEEEAKAFTDGILALVTEFGRGNISKDFLTNWKRSRDYDKDIESAREQGRVDGKNEKIALEKKRMSGSGLPNGNAGGSATSEEVDSKKGNNTADWLTAMRNRG